LAEINFNEIFHELDDKPLLRHYADEIIELYGIPCRLRKWVGIQPVLDPMYQDTPTTYHTDEDLYHTVNTHVYVDYNRFNEVLKAYGHSVETNTTLNGIMKFDDHPKEDDIVELKLPYDDRYYKFQLGSTDVHRDVCYSVVLNVYYQDRRESDF
jgi:hypothetical protein